jgi:DNA-binding PadR family transcriptional regulator
MAERQEPSSLGAWVTLALLCEGEAHGWALVRALAPDGEIGRVWSIRRALVYRTIELLIEAQMIEQAGSEPGTRGSPRNVLRVTRAGRRAIGRWLAEPVPHVRDLRSELLLKLLFAQRAGLDRLPLLDAQHAILADTVLALEGPAPDEEEAAQTVRMFRLETARAGLRFVAAERARIGTR